MSRAEPNPDDFTTARLRAERLRWDHFGDLRVLHGNEEAMAPLGGALPGERSAQALESDLTQWHDAGFGRWMFYTGGDGQFVGRCGVQLATIEGAAEIELLYALCPPFWGVGYAVEMAVAVRDWMFERDPFLRSLAATVKPANVRSQRVLEKSGFQFERKVSYFGEPHLLYRVARAGRGQA